MNNKKLERIYNLDQHVVELLRSNNLLEVLIQKEYTNILINEINLEEQEINNLKESFRQQKNLANDEDFQKWLVDEQTKEEDFIDELTKPYKLAKFCNEKFSPKAQARFLQRKKDLDQVIYSLIRVQDPLLARELVFQLLANETTFENLAEKYSIGAEKFSKGIVGPVPITKSHPTVSQLLRSATPGVVMGPFQVGDVSVILRLETLQEAKLNEQVEQEMTQELFNEWVAEESQEIIRDLINNFESKKKTIAEVS
tara:strand:- start:617 stop:1381 length:765 start_codon:yes stop_codon:yes gene_type:complete